MGHSQVRYRLRVDSLRSQVWARPHARLLPLQAGKLVHRERQAVRDSMSGLRLAAPQAQCQSNQTR